LDKSYAVGIVLSIPTKLSVDEYLSDVEKSIR